MKGKIIMLCSLASLFWGCEEVIYPDLKTTTPQYVIEANLTNKNGGAYVAVSQTANFNVTSTFNGISGAKVTITGDMLPTTTLTERHKGIYTHPFLRGMPNGRYSLAVNINGETFTAECQMPKIVVLDSVFAGQITFFNSPQIFTYVRFQDPKGLGNFYRFKQYQNGLYDNQISVADDDLFDGKLVNESLRPRNTSDENKLKKGDTVTVEFMTISQPVYKYWTSANTGGATGDSNVASPSNPVTNIVGGALGYFSAHTIQSKSYVIK